MTTANVAFRYGAPEIKMIIRKNTVQSYIITASILLLFGASIFLRSWIMATFFQPPPVVEVVLTRSNIETLNAPPETDAPPEPPPIEPSATLAGPAVRAGIPVPVPDASIPEDAKDFASTDDIKNATSIGGDGSADAFNPNSFGGSGGTGTLDVKNDEKPPDEDEFVAYTKDASYDEGALQASVRYPEQARELGISGKVHMRVRINSRGQPDSILVTNSDHSILTKAATSAVRAYTGFTPAIMGDKPVTSWTNINLNFNLR